MTSNPPPDSQTVRIAADWERIEADYRAGTRSTREIATDHKITEGAIRKRAKRDCWERNLKAKVQARADSLVRKELVRTEVRAETATEKQVIELEATHVANVRIGHQSGAARLQALGAKLQQQLGRQTARRMSLKERALTFKTLVDAFGRLVMIERLANGIGNDEELEDPFAVFLRTVKARPIPIAAEPLGLEGPPK